MGHCVFVNVLDAPPPSSDIITDMRVLGRCLGDSPSAGPLRATHRHESAGEDRQREHLTQQRVGYPAWAATGTRRAGELARSLPSHTPVLPPYSALPPVSRTPPHTPVLRTPSRIMYSLPHARTPSRTPPGYGTTFFPQNVEPDWHGLGFSPLTDEMKQHIMPLRQYWILSSRASPPRDTATRSNLDALAGREGASCPQQAPS